MPKIKLTIIILVVILGIAAFFRFWQLNQIPPGLYPDVAINGINALDSIEHRDFKVFYPDNNGREGVFFWLIAFSFLVFGPSIWAMKVVAAVIGFFTVLGTYLLAKEIFKNYNEKKAEYIALLASFFLAISFWHTNFSRIGFRAIMVPFCLVFAFYFLFKGFRVKKIWPFIIAGVFFGLGFYTYISYRFVVFLLAIAFVSWWLVYKKQNQQKVFIRHALYSLIATFIVALPIGIYFLLHPQDFFGRAGGVSIFNDKNPILALGKSLVLHLGMFNFHGDNNWRHNYSNSPMLPWLLGIFFVIGIILSIKELIISLKKKSWQSFSTHSLLISWFILLLAPGFLSAEGAPHALRTIGVIPVVYIFTGLGFFWLISKIKKYYKTRNQILAFYFCISLLFFSVAYYEFNKYFYSWGKSPELNGAFATNYVEIGDYLNSLPDNVKKYVIVNQDGVLVPLNNGLPMPAQTPIFIERAMYGKVRSTYLFPKDLNKIKMENNTIIVPLQYDENLFIQLQLMLPLGQIIKEGGIFIYKINF